jgi:hypothetical protein
MDSLAGIIKDKGHVKILVTGSASQVPTKAFHGNRELARHRAEDTKEVLIQAFKTHGIDETKVEFVKIKAIILGPSYKSDAQKNKETYRKYQYVSLKLASR